MITVVDIFGKDVVITQERWKHVCLQQPELEPLMSGVRETLENPDHVKMSPSDSTVRLYYKFFDDVFNGKFILAVVKTNKRNFLITAYITEYIKAGEELWKRKH